MPNYLPTLLQLKNVSLSQAPQHHDWLKSCYQLAKTSPHPTTKIAALLIENNQVVLEGVNALPPGVEPLPERFLGENRHLYPNHAERDLIFKAAKHGQKTKDQIIVTPWHPCLQCANAIISSGISTIITHYQMIERTNQEWKLEMLKAALVLSEAGIKMQIYDGAVDEEALMHGERWKA